MHKLYSAKYILISDGSNDIFASDLLFLEGEPTKHLDSFGTFYEFYDAVASCKYPWSNHCYCDKSMFLHKSLVKFYGSLDWVFTAENFKAPVSVETQYKEYSTKDYNFDFFKENLSMDDFIIFLREHNLIGGNT